MLDQKERLVGISVSVSVQTSSRSTTSCGRLGDGFGQARRGDYGGSYGTACIYLQTADILRIGEPVCVIEEALCANSC